MGVKNVEYSELPFDIIIDVLTEDVKYSSRKESTYIGDSEKPEKMELFVYDVHVVDFSEIDYIH